jgi:hypothetical protein
MNAEGRPDEADGFVQLPAPNSFSQASRDW